MDHARRRSGGGLHWTVAVPGLLAGLLLATLTGCSMVADMLPAPARSEAPVLAPGRATEVASLVVGDCLAGSDLGADPYVTTVRVVPCAGKHDFEVFDRFPVPGEASPGDDAVTAAAEFGCASRFEGFARVGYSGSELDFSYLTPTEQNWSLGGEGTVSCLIFDPAGAVTGTLEGAAR